MRHTQWIWPLLSFILLVQYAAALPAEGSQGFLLAGREELIVCSCTILHEELFLQNRGITPSTYSLAQNSAGWSALIRTRVFLLPGQSTTIRFFLNPPCEAEGTYSLRTVARSFFGEEQVLSQNVRVEHCAVAPVAPIPALLQQPISQPTPPTKMSTGTVSTILGSIAIVLFFLVIYAGALVTGKTAGKKIKKTLPSPQPIQQQKKPMMLALAALLALVLLLTAIGLLGFFLLKSEVLQLPELSTALTALALVLLLFVLIAGILIFRHRQPRIIIEKETVHSEQKSGQKSMPTGAPLDTLPKEIATLVKKEERKRKKFFRWSGMGMVIFILLLAVGVAWLLTQGGNSFVFVNVENSSATQLTTTHGAIRAGEEAQLELRFANIDVLPYTTMLSYNYSWINAMPNQLTVGPGEEGKAILTLTPAEEDTGLYTLQFPLEFDNGTITEAITLRVIGQQQLWQRWYIISGVMLLLVLLYPAVRFFCRRRRKEALKSFLEEQRKEKEEKQEKKLKQKKIISGAQALKQAGQAGLRSRLRNRRKLRKVLAFLLFFFIVGGIAAGFWYASTLYEIRLSLPVPSNITAITTGEVSFSQEAFNRIRDIGVGIGLGLFLLLIIIVLLRRFFPKKRKRG